MSTPFVSGKNITFISERNLPLDYEFIETGILVNLNSPFDLYENGVSHLVSQSKSGSGQFAARKTNSASGITRYAKAYMIYKKRWRCTHGLQQYGKHNVIKNAAANAAAFCFISYF